MRLSKTHREITRSFPHFCVTTTFRDRWEYLRKEEAEGETRFATSSGGARSYVSRVRLAF